MRISVGRGTSTLISLELTGKSIRLDCFEIKEITLAVSFVRKRRTRRCAPLLVRCSDWQSLSYRELQYLSGIPFPVRSNNSCGALVEVRQSAQAGAAGNSRIGMWGWRTRGREEQHVLFPLMVAFEM